MVKLIAKDMSADNLKGTSVSFMVTHEVKGKKTGGAKAQLTAPAQIIDAAVDGALTQLVLSRRTVGENGACVSTSVQNKAVPNVVVLGLGDVKKLTPEDWLKVGISAGKTLDSLGVTAAAVALGDLGSDADVDTFIEGLLMALYRFDMYKTDTKEHMAAALKNVTFLVDDAKALGKRLSLIEAIVEGQTTARELVNLPPNVANPALMAERAKRLTKLGLKVDVLDEKQLTKLGMNLIMAVGGGASKADQPRLITVTYNGGKRGEKPVAVVGKGVMFDTGGYNLKPTGFMESMKCDMGGAAVVMGLMEALAKRKAKVNVVGVMSCAMNMVSGEAFRPSDVLKSYKGLTVEIGNTDAEGRLVLADAIAYTIDKKKPSAVIDLATLTGAVMVALGGAYAGLFSNDEDMATGLTKAGKGVGEHLWRLPINDCYAAKPHIADMNNDGSRYGGSSTAAVFLKRFAGDTPWAHLDIAGVSFTEKTSIPGMIPIPGGTGFGVRLLTKYFEGK